MDITSMNMAFLATLSLITGWLAITIAVVIGYIVTGIYGYRVYRRIVRCYHLRVVGRLLDRMEKEGVGGLRDGTWADRPWENRT